MLRPGRFRLNLSTGSTNSPVQRVKHRNENMMVSHRAIWGGGQPDFFRCRFWEFQGGIGKN